MLVKFLIAFILSTLCDVSKSKLPLTYDERDVLSDRAECIFGKETRELGSTWIPDLGVPIGVLYCMRCTCVPSQKKRRIVGRVQCRNIKNECPTPSCENPVTLPGRCCKTCPGDDKYEPDIVPQNVVEEEDRRINHFGALLTTRSSLVIANETNHKNKVVATGRFVFHRRNLHYSFYISKNAPRPVSLHFLDSQGNFLEEFILSQGGVLLNSQYQNATGKICGIWRRLPQEYRRLLKAEKLYALLVWDNQDQISGKIMKYVALASEQFSSLLEPAPGSDSIKMAGSGGMAIISTSSQPFPSLNVAIVFNGLFINNEKTNVSINVALGLEDKKQNLLEEKILVDQPAHNLNLIDVSSAISLADLRSLSRGKVVLTVASVMEPNALKLMGNVMSKVTCEIFQAALIADKDLATPTTGLAWMYLNNQGALIYNIQVENIIPEQYHTITLTDTTGKRKAEVLSSSFNSGWASGVEDRLVHKILEPLYNNRLDMRIAVENGSVHGHLNAKLVADANDAPIPFLLKRENHTLSAAVVGIAWIAVDSECYIHYDVSISGLGHEKKLELYLEMYPIMAPGAPVSNKRLEVFEGNHVEGRLLKTLTKEELDMLDSGVTFIRLNDFNTKTVLLSATVSKVTLPMSCRPPYKDNNVPVIYDLPDSYHEDCFFEGKFYKKGVSWMSKNPCQMCYCQDGQTTCDKMTCPELKCSTNNVTIAGECCPICNDPEILKRKEKCLWNGMTYSSGSKFHPFLIPMGFDYGTVCTCDPIDLEIKCRRIATNSQKSSEMMNEDNIDSNLLSSKAPKEEILDAEQILREGGCKNQRDETKPYRNGTSYHPFIAYLGDYKCVTCKCKNGQNICAREPCEWKNCKMIFDMRKARSKSRPLFAEYCCSLKECKKMRHKRMEERSAHKQ